MTDSEIIELLETCGEIANCKKCSFYNAEKNNCLIKLNTYALDLINRQQAELEKAKSEAVREFAEKLKECAFECPMTITFGLFYVLNDIGGCGAPPESWADGWDKAINAAIEAVEKLKATDDGVADGGYTR
ncbi:MAG: hypothetical protein J6A37_06905 [Oscillospiraceae bacterium]|nr:hypothetical protein [Oscillospiraceae bacterium]